jgi:hypothetical protein
MGWVLLLDADDEAIVDGVERMRALGEKLGAWAVVSPRVQVRADASGGVRERVKAAPAEWADRALPGRGCVFAPLDVFSSTGMLVSGNAIAAGVRFDEGLKIGEDRDFLARCAERGPVGVSSVPGVRYTLHGDGGTNLTSATHMRRRIADHIVLLDRWCDADSRAHMRALTAWLINAASKAGVDGASWDALVSAAGRHGLGVPLKARLRRLVATRSGA